MTDPKKPEGQPPDEDRADGGRATEPDDGDGERGAPEGEAGDTADEARKEGVEADAPDPETREARADALEASGADDAAETVEDAEDADAARRGESEREPAEEDTEAAPGEAEASPDAEAGDTSVEAETPRPGDDAGDRTEGGPGDDVSAAEASGPDPAQDRGAEAERPAAPEPAPVERVVEKRGGLIPGFIGGVIAVAGAVFAAPYVLPEGMRPVTSLAPVEDRLAEQSAELETLAGRLDEAVGTLEAAPSAADLTALSERIGTVETELGARLDSLEQSLSALRTRDDELAARIDEVERAPLADATDPEVVAALESYAAEVEALRDEVQAQTEANERLIEEAAAATAEARAAAEAEAQAAAEQAAMAARQQALVDVQEALDSGQPFAEPLSRLSDEMEVPEALSAVAEDGVPTLASLQADFAGPARAALEAARRATAGDAPTERGLTFLQTQLGVRSLAPREGDSADAILSRAEAEARAGDLQAAVEELQALPEPALAEIQGWIDRARTRAEATQAADRLAASVATN
mgnify:CR=1 FL=1